MKRLLAGLAAGVAVAIVALGAAWYAVYGDRTHPQSPVQVVVERGATFDDIARELAGQGVIGNILTFRALAKLRGQDIAVRAGEYRFAPHVTQSEVLRALVTGGAQVASWVTIPEGFTAAQIAARLAAEGLGSEQALHGDFMSEQLFVERSADEKPRRLPLPEHLFGTARRRAPSHRFALHRAVL